ncbi:MAG: PEPxxWA-CTERM sorting domain-containing protein [Phenylobacterium sp.]|uniref:PEPxxWA-CTERM sorting domain-containing protein n=1 Tax=Phenylobacterium sp. TaxID=1871053 RepID=UPI001A3B4D9E|nr:PEPxxWA-CTERM sorting domain-containing protein [Phenylobacterium sp.]MBL8770769.1 PEPxxWA-CTERM sorting domain-containing protein [Phenylobacterium sp.]
MSSALRGVFVAGFALLALSTPAQAELLHLQAGTNEACPPGACRTSTLGDVNGSLYGFQTFDNFTLSRDARIQTVTWRGFVWQDGVGSGTAPDPITETWQVGFYADNLATPDTDANLYTANIDAADVTVTLLGVDVFSGDNVNVYEWSATLPTDFLATGGVRYWVSPVSLQASFSPLFGWSASTPASGLAYQRQFANGAWGPLSGNANNRAYSLSGAYVPEPGTWALMILGFAGAGAMLRRTRPRAGLAG